MSWILAITLVIVITYANKLNKRNLALTEERDYWRKKAIRANADLLRLEVKRNGNS
jgi:hypothetical protein